MNSSQGVCKKNSGLHWPLGDAINSFGFGVEETLDTEGANQCFSGELAQNSWGGCLLFTWVNLISFVGGSGIDTDSSSYGGTKLSRTTFSISQNMPLISIRFAGASIREFWNRSTEKN